jgi:glyoxylase-like metal-dependent hydrolase (beta-lactamase superfamily II)
LYAPAEKILISADALWQNGFGIIFPELEGASGFAEQAAVLDLIEVLDIRLVIPGHGAPFGDVAAAISRARSRLAYMTADPVRHTRYALKALIAFWLLDVRQISLADIEKRIRASRLMALAAAQFGQPLPALVRRMAEELSASGTASLEHEMLHSRA